MMMRGMRTQYVLAYAALGSLGPFLPVYLSRQEGLTDAQIGVVLGVGGLAVLLTPVLLTRFADLGVQTRNLLAGSFLISVGALLGLSISKGFLLAVALYLLHSLAEKPVNALQDGLFFRARALAGAPQTPFHRVRVWGTVGFIVPSLLLYDLVHRTGSTSVVLGLSVAFAGLAAVNTRRLPPAEARIDDLAATGGEPAGPDPGAVPDTRDRATRAALRALASRDIRTFVIAMFLVNVASAAWFGFYPLYLTNAVGIDERSVGLVFNVGVVLEIGWMLAFGWMIRRIGLRRLMMAGGIAEALRLGLLAIYPSLAVAVGTQALHGLIVVISSVAPQVFLDSRAEERFRSSIQGVYTTTVVGGGRLLGSVLAGQLAAFGFGTLFGVAAGFAIAAVLLFSTMSTTAALPSRRQ